MAKCKIKEFSKKLSMENLLKKDLKFVEKKKIFFIIPLCFLLAGIIAAISYGFTKGTPFNLGMDFTGGYVIRVQAGATINDDNYQEYSEKVENIIKSYRFEHNGKNYPVVFSEIQKLGSGAETNLRVLYRAHKSVPSSQVDTIMELLNEDLVKAINAVVGVWAPTNVKIDNQTATDATATVTFDVPVLSFVEDNTFKTELGKDGITLIGNIDFVLDDSENPVYNTIKFNFSGDLAGKSESDVKAMVKTAATLEMPYAAQAITGEMIGSSVRMELIYTAILAIIITLVLMLIYIFIRFEFASGVAAIIALAHDVLIMFIMMTIFHIEINSTFIAVVITLLAYSINNTIIIFDRVRENRNDMYTAGKPTTATFIANKSIKDTLSRNIYTTGTTVIMIGMIALVCGIGGISSMVTFALPIIFGLLAGFFSSLCIAPALWVMFKRNDAGTPKRSFGSLAKRNKDTAAGSDLKNN